MNLDSPPFDVLGGESLPNCPFKFSKFPSTTPIAINNPAIVLTTTTGFFLCLFYASFSKSGCKILNRNVNHQSLKNNLWAAYFAILAISFTIDSIRYLIDLPHATATQSLDDVVVAPQVIDAWLLLSSAFFRSLACLFLNLALNHHRVCKSYILFSTTSTNQINSYSSTNNFIQQQQQPVYVSKVRRTSLASRNADTAGFSEEETTGLLLDVEEVDDDDEEGLDFDGKVESYLEWGWRLVVAHVNYLMWGLFFLRIFGILLLIDPPSSRESFWRFPPILTEPGTITYSPFLFYLTLIFGILQNIPIVITTYHIAFSYPPATTTTTTLFANTNNEVLASGSSTTISAKARIIVVLGVLMGAVWWIEPSVLARGVGGAVRRFGNESLSWESNVCVVPPWWWYNSSDINPPSLMGSFDNLFFLNIGNLTNSLGQKNVQKISSHRHIRQKDIIFQKPTTEAIFFQQQQQQQPEEKKDAPLPPTKHSPPPPPSHPMPKKVLLLHGWASVVDLLQWAGLVSIVFLFWFVRIEYTRIKRTWVDLIVRDTMETFSFNRS